VGDGQSPPGLLSWQRVYPGRELSLAGLAKLLTRAAGISINELCRSYKDSGKLTEIRERFVHVATRIFFYTEAEVARFLGLTPYAVALTNRRFDGKLRRDSGLENQVIQLLIGNT
jgi:hypothetical protein